LLSLRPGKPPGAALRDVPYSDGDRHSARWGHVEDDPYEGEDPYSDDEDPAVTPERIARQSYGMHHPDDHSLQIPQRKGTNVKRWAL
jgi:hypothetical protein